MGEETPMCRSRATGSAKAVGIGAVTRALMVIIAFLIGMGAAFAASPTDPPPAKVRLLIELLDDPSVREWLKSKPTPESSAKPAFSVTRYLGDRLAAIQAHVSAIVAAAPRLPGDAAHASGVLAREIEKLGFGRFLLALLAMSGAAFAAVAAWRRPLGSILVSARSTGLSTSRERLRALMLRFVLAFAAPVTAALAAIVTLAAFAMPPLAHEATLGLVLVVFCFSVALALGRFLFAPPAWRLDGLERFPAIPCDETAAAFRHRRLVALIGWLSFGWITVELFTRLGGPIESRHLVAYVLGLGLLAIAIDGIWRAGSAETPGMIGAQLRGTAWTVYFLLLWVSWAFGATSALSSLLTLGGIVLATRVVPMVVENLHRPEADQPNLLAVTVSRGIRSVMIVGLLLLLAHSYEIDLWTSGADAQVVKLARGIVFSVIIMLVADFTWFIISGLIDRKISEHDTLGAPDSERSRRRGRLRTLLPIVRLTVLIVVTTLAGLMALASLGVEVGPLLAGAGIVGVAVGFGSQALVRDIIGGMFYLLDDAFRVGEYIQSGNYKGTVESINLRSVRLRHHRGPVFTVPYSLLGAVQNMSRDWVIDKLVANVPFDTDLGKVKKLIKGIAAELSADVELGPLILEPLKLQGVAALGDYGMTIHMKMMTKPGEQFVVRRRAYARILEVFAANGIALATPSVAVSSIDHRGAAAAQAVLEKGKVPDAAT